MASPGTVFERPLAWYMLKLVRLRNRNLIPFKKPLRSSKLLKYPYRITATEKGKPMKKKGRDYWEEGRCCMNLCFIFAPMKEIIVCGEECFKGVIVSRFSSGCVLRPGSRESNLFLLRLKSQKFRYLDRRYCV